MYFFFQAEDGIRDRNVTGVQTCALPIYVNNRVQTALAQLPAEVQAQGVSVIKRSAAVLQFMALYGEDAQMTRSEERRVGKECKYRRTRKDYKQRYSMTDLIGGARYCYTA